MALEAKLRTFGLYESDAATARREEVLGILHHIVSEWATATLRARSAPKTVVDNHGSRIFTFGSYRLGVQSPDSDIDTLCVVPLHVERADFFGPLADTILGYDGVESFSAVPDAFVPVMKFVMKGVHIDLLFAQMRIPTIPGDFNVFDNRHLANLDDKSILSLNGTRVTDMILSLVPNADTFRTTLRAVRLWAKRRGIFSNVSGMLAGVSCAILTARICQLCPDEPAEVLLRRFFAFYSTWKWPMPIILCDIQEDADLGMPVWKPSKRDRMPVITPAYPSINSMHNANSATMRMMKDAFKYGVECGDNYDLLFQHTELFLQYKRYLQVQIWSGSSRDQHKWLGFIESKMRHLVTKLDRNERFKTECVSAYPYPKAFKSDTYDHPYCHSIYIGIDLDMDLITMHMRQKILDLSYVHEFFMNLIESGQKPGMGIELKVLKASKLPDYCLMGQVRKKKLKTQKGNPKRSCPE